VFSLPSDPRSAQESTAHLLSSQPNYSVLALTPFC
jgi:hypothetical protein